MRRAVWAWCSVVVAAACSSSPPPAPPIAHAPASAIDATPVPDARDEHAEIAAAHRVLEAEQQEAYAATCAEPEPRAPHPRCLPSCYPTETADARAGKKVTGKTEIRELVCAAPGTDASAGAFVIANEIDGAKLAPRKVKGRFPTKHKKGSWQAELETALLAVHRPKLARGDVLHVGASWRKVVHPVTGERMRCVTVSHFTRSMRRALDGCGADGALACEAMGNAAARGINVVHYRLAEARALHKAGKTDACQQAALEAVAVARGLPRWRQYMKLNVATWTDYAGYRTRFDGILDEDTLFATAATLGTEAEAVYAACGGPSSAATTVEQEQSFHTCW